MIQKIRSLVTAIAIVGALAFAALPAVSYAQEAEAAPAAAAAHGGGDMSLIDKFQQGGWVMYVNLLGSFIMVWIGIDATFRTTRKRAMPAAQVAQLRELFKQGDYVGAYNYAKANPNPTTDVVRAGISFLPDGKNMTEEAMFNEINRLQGRLQGRISYLSVIGVCAPMVGLTGTVNGMMGAFASLGTGSGSSDTSAMAAHIGEVLVATAFGLFVSIPAFIVYYVLRNRITIILHDIQEVASSLFRKMPYESFEGYHIGDEEIFAALPNWVEQPAAIEEQPAA